ncbi:hypothetical protein SK571_15050 [Lentzea sp. BCCO 10_0798]|uniref:Uncharacterized protein n=1 Tax=Lentzea kristufekii TaxID=3095430 RepID=A0ABU4TQY4_9PSEU|nr:hypothetical protein [Lentzea sp. BCCO 10_0798]MDX8050705.1 hypothetical protein [Lentzea sp. BCCO 10_0798]
MGAPAIPPIRLGPTGTGLAVERLDAGVRHTRFTDHAAVFRATGHRTEFAGFTPAVQSGGLPAQRTTSSPYFAA